MPGKFIVIDGPDGCGKSTQVRLLSSYLRRRGYSVQVIREPGGTAIGERIRRILLDPKNQQMTVITELFLYMASRSQLVQEVIKPALKQGKIIISDRFLSSSIVYQGLAGGVGKNMVEEIGKIATEGITPDLVFILDVSPKEGLRRAQRLKGHPDRMEKKQLLFHRRVCQGFRQLARSKPDFYKLIPPGPIPKIQSQLREIVTAFLAKDSSK